MANAITLAAPAPTEGADSRERLLQAAAEVLAAQGNKGFKVVEVAARAGANVALINYHFGGRDGLIVEVLRRAGAEVAKERAAGLQALTAASPRNGPSLQALVRCWLDPVFRSVALSRREGMLMLTAHLLFAAELDASYKRLLVSEILVVDHLFVAALGRRLPRLTRDAIAWRMACAVGSYCFVLGQREPVAWLSLSGGGAPDLHAAYEQLVAFTVGGFAAPPAADPSAARPRTRRPAAKKRASA